MAAPALPFYDVPNHLARLYVLGGDSASPIRQTYAPSWGLMPDLGIDLIYRCVHAFAAPQAAIRLCIAGSILLLTACVCRIQQVLWGRIGHLAALAPVLLTGLCVYMGYVNYTLAVAIAFAGISLYLGWRPDLSPARVTVLSAIATLTWFSHVAGFAVFGFLLAALDIFRPAPASGASRPQDWARRAVRTLRLAAAVFGPGLVLSLLAEKQLPVPVLSYEGVSKLRMLLSPFILTGGRSDLLLWSLVVAALALAVRCKAIQVSPAVRPALAAFAFVIAICPWRVGSAIDVDARMVMPLAALALSGTRVRPSLGTVPLALCGAALLGVVLLRDVDFFRMGRAEAGETATFRRLAAELPDRSAILTVQADDDDTCGPGASAASPPMIHMSAYAAIDRGFYSPLLFTAPGMQPLRSIRPGFPSRAIAELPPSVELLREVTRAGSAAALLAVGSPEPKLRQELQRLRETGGMPFVGDWRANYQAVLVLRDGCGSNPLPADLHILGSGQFFSLFRAHPPAPHSSR